VTVGVTDSSVRLVEARTVNVTVEIVPSPEEREVTGVPVRWRNLGDGLSARVTPSLARVTIRGQRSALQSLRSDAIEAFVDLAGLGSGRYNLQVRVDPSQSFGVIEVTPAVVDVTIR
jgi:YbbR domain-containing protein